MKLHNNNFEMYLNSYNKLYNYEMWLFFGDSSAGTVLPN